RIDRRRETEEVGHEHFDAASRHVTPHGTNGRRPVRGAAVGEIVTVHRRDHDVRELQGCRRLADAPRLLAVFPCRLAVRDRTVPAVPGADITEAPARGRGVFPTLPDVTTVRLLRPR